MSTRPDLAGVIERHGDWSQIGPQDNEGRFDLVCYGCGDLLFPGIPDHFGEARMDELARLHLAAALNAAIDAWLADEGTREAVARAIDTADECEHERQAWADHDLIYHCPTCRTTAALAALTTPTTTEDHR